MKTDTANKSKKDIRRLIDEKLMTNYQALADSIGLSRQTIYNIMEQRAKPTKLTIKKICFFFKVDFRDYI